MIQIRGLHKFFNKGKQNEIHVINDVTLDLPEKGMVAIFGKSGCGKTTLLNVIGGLDGFAQGSVQVEGQDICRDPDGIRNRYIGYIFQNYNLNPTQSCFDNVADALRLCGMRDIEMIEARVTAALTNVGMEKYARRTPDTLSGGQQQRIAIARAIVKNPRIILADEPTGNLDEANTVMIMDLLKEIAKDHLVILVTHEANLVDYYCDTVIELSDGGVRQIRENAAANGFSTKNKNDIYLGELPCTVLSDGNAQITYYGDAMAEPVRLRIVNSRGKLYLHLDTPKVQILDESSEVKLREGVYEETQEKEKGSMDMSALPPVEGTRFGRLFSLGSSIRSGFAANFQKRKKGKKVLSGCMALFAAVVVMMSAVFGTAFSDLITAKNAYNHHVFYVYTPDGATSQKLNAALGEESSGVDYLRLHHGVPSGDARIHFLTGQFETFSLYAYESNFETNAVYLDVSLAKDLPLIEGKKDGLATEEILITTKVADDLLKKSTLGYITKRQDLIGLIVTSLTVDGQKPRVAGIVGSEESAIYLTELGMAKYVNAHTFTSLTGLASHYGMEVAAGEAVLAVRADRTDAKYPKVGESITVQGRSLRVSEIRRLCTDYTLYITFSVNNNFR